MNSERPGTSRSTINAGKGLVLGEVNLSAFDLVALARMLRIEPCPDRLNVEVDVAGYGDTEKEAKEDLELMEEAVATLLEAADTLKCTKKHCEKGNCVFDWAPIGDPKCETLPATKSKKHKIDIPKTVVCRQKIRYGCLCDHTF